VTPISVVHLRIIMRKHDEAEREERQRGQHQPVAVGKIVGVEDDSAEEAVR
jgi:hypothetical protein